MEIESEEDGWMLASFFWWVGKYRDEKGDLGRELEKSLNMGITANA